MAMNNAANMTGSGSHPPDSPTSPPRGGVPGARMSLALLLGLNLMNYIDRSVLAAVEPLISRELFPDGAKDAQFKMGLLATAFLVSYMVSAPVFGWLGDKWRRWPIIGIGAILFSLASGASGLSTEKAAFAAAVGLGGATGFIVLLITRAFVGIGEGAYAPVAPSIISDMYPVERRGAVMSWFYIAIPVGSALGYVLGGQIGEHFGWRAAFYAVVLPGLALGIWCFFRQDPPRGASDAVVTKSAGFRWADLRVLVRTPSYVLNVAGMTAMTFAIGGVSFWMPRYVSEFRGAGTLGQTTLIFGAITVVGGIVATLAGGWVGDRLRGRYPGSYLLVSGIAMLAGFPLFAAVMITPFPACWVVLFLAVVCLFFNTGPSNTAIANVTHPAMRSVAFAVCIFVIHALGDAISPPLIGYVTDASDGNMNVGFGLVSVAVLVAGVFWMWGARHLARDTVLAPTRK